MFGDSLFAPRALLATFLSLPCAAIQACQDDEDVQAIRLDREQLKNTNWIYHDFAEGVAEAKRSGKPLLVVFR
jgi:hypothetical protein